MGLNVTSTLKHATQALNFKTYDTSVNVTEIKVDVALWGGRKDKARIMRDDNIFMSKCVGWDLYVAFIQSTRISKSVSFP